jgi:hypothetical protein
VAGAKAEADPIVAKIAKRAETRMVLFIFGDGIIKKFLQQFFRCALPASVFCLMVGPRGDGGQHA